VNVKVAKRPSFAYMRYTMLQLQSDDSVMHGHNAPAQQCSVRYLAYSLMSDEGSVFEQERDKGRPSTSGEGMSYLLRAVISRCHGW